MAKLVILQDGIEARTVSLDADTIQIGSAEGNAIRIRSPEVSREHCEIRRTGLQYRLVDLESKTGTRVNGEFVNQHLLDDGDEVELGSLRLRFEREGPTNGVRVASRGQRRAPPKRRPPPPKRTSAAPAAFVSIAVGMALVLVTILALRSGEEEVPVNEQVLLEVERLESEDRLTDALEAARGADSSRRDEAYHRIQQKVDEMETRLYGATRAEREYARNSAEELLLRIEKGNVTPKVLLNEIDDLLRRYGRLNDASLARLRTRRKDVEARAAAAERDKVPERFADLEATIPMLEGQQQFQRAIDAYQTFLSKNRELMSEDQYRTYRDKADAEKERLQLAASKAWRDADDYAKNLLGRREKLRAIRVYQKVATNFGIAMFEEKAKRALKELGVK